MPQTFPERFIAARVPANLMFLLMVCTSGCVHTGRHDDFAMGGAEVLLPQMTSAATGPVGVWLTQGDAFESEFTMTFQGASGPPAKLSGQIFARGGKLRLEAAFGKPNGKSGQAGEFRLIWDAAAHQGFVVSEALQGYAPIKETIRFTNLLTQASAGQTERIEGHVVDKVNVTVTGSNGVATTFQLLQARDLGDLPLEIHSPDSSPSFALALSKIQQVSPAEDLFLPPDGYTKYDNETAMLSELAMRQQSVFRSGHANEEYHPPGNDGHSYGTPNMER